MRRKRERDGRHRPIQLRNVYGDTLIPSFTTSDECKEYNQTHFVRKASNPDMTWLDHPISLLVNWGQVDAFLLRQRDREQVTEASKDRILVAYERNRFRNAMIDTEGIGKIAKEVRTRLDLNFHQNLTRKSVENTLSYLFFHMRCGIYVRIKDNRLAMFCPFANSLYENNWSSELNIDLKTYYSEKVDGGYFRKENILPISKWWANGNIMCNESSRKVWGDHLTVQLRDMLIRTCNSRTVPDVEFFINKRDFPQLKKDLSEPYDFLYDPKKCPVDLKRHKYETYAPILSFFVSSEEFADIPIPSSDDWEIATGRVFPSKAGDLYSRENRTKFNIEWKEKQATAFFRGTATGGGVLPHTNQRLKLAQLSHYWKTDSRYNEENPIDQVPFLDAGVVTWNIRDKKMPGQPMTFLRKDQLDFELVERVPMYQQAKYKYLIYVEGHCAAARYGFLMSIGCVILKVESRCIPKELWSFPLLEPWVDHIPVAADCSNLAERIAWCKQNDEKCQQIAANAQKIYEKYLGLDSILDYYQFIFYSIADNYAPDFEHKKKSATEHMDKKSTLKPLTYDSSRKHVYDFIRHFSYLSISAIEPKNVHKISMNSHVAFKFPNSEMHYLISLSGCTYLVNMISRDVLEISDVKLVYRKDQRKQLKETLAVCYILSKSPLKLLIVDCFVILGTFLRNEDWKKRIRIAQVELEPSRNFIDMEFVSECRLDSSEAIATTRDQGICFYPKFVAKEHSPYAFEWFGSIKKSNQLFDITNIDFHNCPTNSPYSVPDIHNRRELDSWNVRNSYKSSFYRMDNCTVPFSQLLSIIWK